jgi:protein-L-isoaspartate(D-aspartate) O-methyltransferase
VPAPLLEQLKEGGKLIAPVGESEQDLVLYTRTKDGFDKETLLPVRFVPMTGKAQEKTGQ